MANPRIVCLTCWIIPVVAAQVHGGPADPGSQIKKVAVMDAAGAPVPDARVHRFAMFAWNDQARVARWVDKEPLLFSDPNGELSFERAHLGPSGAACLIVDSSLERMGSFCLQRKDWARTQTIRLDRPARIKAVFQNRHVGMSKPSLQISYCEPETKRVFGQFITVIYAFDGPVSEIPLEVPCPGGCHLRLSVSADGGVCCLEREIPPLQPGQTLDLGSIELQLVSGYQAIGRQAPELQVAEWIKGEPVALAGLRGKLVLLEFWSLSRGSWRESMAALTSLHGKYAHDGLVIVAVHDSSENKNSLLRKGRESLGLSAVPFAVAVDSPVAGDVPADEQRPKGGTIDAYGITSFPTILIINKDGQVEDTRFVSLENRIHLLLYGQPIPRPTAGQRLLMAGQGPFVTVLVAGGLILVFIGVLLVLWSRASRDKTHQL